MFKNFIKNILVFFHLDVTQNMKYDRLTNKILKKELSKNSNCIDVGAHKGEILDLFIKYAPNGNHSAFEPIPSFFNALKSKYISQEVYPFALSEKSGQTTFQFVKNAPAYSGIKQRKYAVKNPEIEKINVEMKALDEVISSDKKIDLIKIDVEGGEFDVLKGAKKTILKNAPIIIFECGKGASEFYGTTPDTIYNFVTKELNLEISTLESFLSNKKSLSSNSFSDFYTNGSEYYFVAH